MRANPSIFTRGLTAALLLLVSLAAPAAAKRMDVEVWTDRGDDAVYEPGDAMRVKVRTSEDAYLIVYEIDSNGDVNLLYPWKRGRGLVEGHSTLRLPAENSDVQLVVEQETGQGFLVAIASDQPFRELPWFLRPYDPQAASVGYEDVPEARSGHEEGVDEHGRVVGDPYVAMERIRRAVVAQSGDSPGFATAYSTYYVHEQVRYPRYLCGDCHRPGQWSWWTGFDPYYTHCSVVDFRVNWSWCWGPPLYTAYVPYYYYVVRSDCPPRYNTWRDNRTRFSSWDGWGRWNELWGGQLRRYKERPAPAPVGYVPPPAPGTVWKKAWTPPGLVPPDVRRDTRSPGGGREWLNRDRGDGKPVFRDDPRSRPSAGGGRLPDLGRGGDNGRGRGDDTPRWRPPGGGDVPRGGNSPAPPEGRDQPRGDRGERQRGSGDRTPSYAPPRNDPPPSSPPRQDPPRRDPPRNDPPRFEPPRPDPGYRPPASDPPRFSPPSGKQDPPKGKGGNGGKG